MMNKPVYKRYMNLTNIVLRLSDGTETGKADAILVNSHLVGGKGHSFGLADCAHDGPCPQFDN